MEIYIEGNPAHSLVMRSKRLKFLASLVAILVWPTIVGASATRPGDAEQAPIIVFAAASLTDVLTAQASAWSQASGQPQPRLSFGPSATMARQAAAGAPADLVLSANRYWIDFLARKGLIQKTPKDFAYNRLVLAVPVSHDVSKIETLDRTKILATLGDRRLAIADPALAPAGDYARRYLQYIGLWGQLQNRLVIGTSARQTLMLIERGGMAGFVYVSDAKASDLVKEAGRVPFADLPKITYMAGLMATAPEEAQAFLEHLRSHKATGVWQQYGFEPLAHP